MPDILHKVDVKSSPNDTYRALSTLEGLDGWWTRTTKGDRLSGGINQTGYPPSQSTQCLGQAKPKGGRNATRQ